MHRRTIAVIFGGCSEEHDVSIKSAREIAANIDQDKYEPVYIGITRQGAWMRCHRPDFAWEQGETVPALISCDKTRPGLLLERDDGFTHCRIDAVLPVIHGKMGEDGVIQGLLEVSGIPYVGCDVQSSVLCMDKSLAYIKVRAAGIEVPRFWVYEDGPLPQFDGFPLFVKPARSGSSFGVTKVNEAAGLPGAIETARRYDQKILLESAIEGSEVGCAVLGNGDGLIFGEIDQITLSNGLFRIHQENSPEKGSENAIIKVPADLPMTIRRQIQDTAGAIYRALGCRGLARVDMFWRRQGGVVLNEVNTIPGFTSYSRYPRMMAAAGFNLKEVIERSINLALEG